MKSEAEGILMLEGMQQIQQSPCDKPMGTASLHSHCNTDVESRAGGVSCTSHVLLHALPAVYC